MSVNPKDLERLGITQQQWDEQRAWYDRTAPVEIRYEGDSGVLSDALKALSSALTYGATRFSITHHTPKDWGCAPE